MGPSQGAHRHEAIEFSQRLDDESAADNPVRFMDAFVDELDLETRGFRQVVAAATGRPSDQPGDRLTLYIDSDLDRCRSSRRLAQETPRNVELMWRLKKRRPDHQTLANCRRDPLRPRRGVCRTLTWLAKQLERFGGELVAIDGSQCRAVNAPGRHVTQATRAQLIAQMEARVEGQLKELEAADGHDAAGPPGGARAAALQTKIAALRERRRRHMRDDATAACRTCPLKAQCTRNQGGRRITRWVDEALLEQMEPRAQRSWNIPLGRCNGAAIRAIA